MNDDLDALLRDHYRRAADEIHAGPGTVRRFQDAGRDTAPARFGLLRRRTLPSRRWTFPLLAGAFTAAVLVAVAVLFWPGARNPDPPRPLTPPASPAPAPTSRAPSRPVSPVPSAGLTTPEPSASITGRPQAQPSSAVPGSR
ncbi:hypothetical protein E1293_25115 [Actinomadura darangshiensis]|uniref:Uncharacterized protein n=1 Tax=Actinomadura darangshiensis TaxID=705336 RepID=A0A4V2YUK5_9ACTN|nr:hypothetical protein [Actinomadura darangshiensis]TDD77997.1 hypothetical protein E1293_25115 [Actinomadura darangshiensis]